MLPESYFLTFLGKSNPKTGFCSNWHPSQFVLDGKTHKTAESGMMCGKACLFPNESNQKLIDQIIEADDPKIVKALGRQVADYNESVWQNNRKRIMLRVLLAKFSQNPYLWELLDDSGDRIIVEAADYDSIWGIGMSETDPNILDRSKWGLNLLGKTLMRTRAILRNFSDDGVIDRIAIDRIIDQLNDPLDKRTIEFMEHYQS